MKPETAARAARLGVLVDTQPAWHYKDADALAAALGLERLAHFIGLQTWRQAGVDVAINTDHMFGLDPERRDEPVQSVADDVRGDDAADRIRAGWSARRRPSRGRRRCA